MWDDTRCSRIEVAKVFLLDLWVSFDLFGRTIDEDLSLVDDVASIDDAENLTGGVVGNQNRDPGITQLANDALDSLYGNRVDPSERFVKHDDSRIADKAFSDL